MLEVSIIASNSRRRAALLERMIEYTSRKHEGVLSVPAVNLRAVSPHEIRFHRQAAICVLCEQMVLENMCVIADCRNAMPESLILMQAENQMANLVFYEQACAYGLDDFLPPEFSPLAFLRKLVHRYSQKTSRQQSKIVLVSGAKGGVGTTSITAAFGEALSVYGKKVLLVDNNDHSQDLARFVGAPPFLNEHLGSLLDGRKPINMASVEECLARIWDETEGYCLASAPDFELENSSTTVRNYRSILEILDVMFDVILVDGGQLHKWARVELEKICQINLVVVDDDPACYFAASEHVRRVGTRPENAGQVHLLENFHWRSFSASKSLRRQFDEVAGTDPGNWCPNSIPHSRKGKFWPASGSTLFSLDRACERALMTNLEHMGILQAARAQSLTESLFTLLRALRKPGETPVLPQKSSRALELPEPERPKFFDPIAHVKRCDVF